MLMVLTELQGQSVTSHTDSAIHPGISPSLSMHREAMEYDPSIKGPTKDRGCTDTICCVLFCICFLGMIAVAAVAFARGDPRKLLYPTDTHGNICGTGNYANKPNLLFFDMTICAKMGIGVVVNGCPTPQVCVETCPSTYWTWYTSIVDGDSDTERAKMYCKSTVNPLTSSKTIQKLVQDEDCAAYYIKSTAIVGRCIPSIFSTLLTKTLSLKASDGTVIVNKHNQTLTGTELEEGTKYLAYFLSAKEYGMKIYQDVCAAWWMILIGLGLAMILSFIWIIIMRWIACPMVWISIIAFIGLFVFATYYCIATYLTLRNNEDAQLSDSIQFTTNLEYYQKRAIPWLVFGCAAGVILLITLILIIFLRQRIMITISLINESSRVVGSMIFTLFYPLFPFLLEIILFGFWGASAVYLASMGTGSYAAFNKTQVNTTIYETVSGYTQTVYTVQEVIIDITDKIDCSAISGDSAAATELSGFCNFIKYGGDEYTIYLQIFQLFMMLWCMNFIVAFGRMVLAGAFASYYWAFNKPSDIPKFPLAASTWRSLRYHLGTLAFGSLIIAPIQMILIVLKYLDTKLKGSKNQVATFLLRCLQCCFVCLKEIFTFMNKNAYIMCAIYGTNFCMSAKNAFMLIIQNIIRVAVIDKVTDWVLLLSKLLVVVTIGTLGYFFFNGQIPWVNTVITIPILNFSVVPLVILCIGTYFIAAAFFSVYDMAVDTLFLCSLEDLEQNNGSEEKPMGILMRKNKQEKEDQVIELREQQTQAGAHLQRQ